MYVAGYSYGRSGEVLAQRSFGDKESAKAWLVEVIQAEVAVEKQKGINTFQAFSLAAFSSLEAPFVYRGPNFHVYYVTEAAYG